MKKLLILTLCLAPICVFGDDHGPDAGRLPSQGVEIGGKGADTNFHFLLTDNTGQLQISSGGTNGTAIPARSMLVGGSDGTNIQPIHVDTLGNLIPSAGAATGATTVNSAAYEASRVLKGSAGTLMAIHVFNSKASAQWVQLFNSTTVPADTAVPVFTATIPATSNYDFIIPPSGLPFTTGIAVSNSSTGPTKTIGSADCYFTAIVR